MLDQIIQRQCIITALLIQSPLLAMEKLYLKQPATSQKTYQMITHHSGHVLTHTVASNTKDDLVRTQPDKLLKLGHIRHKPFGRHNTFPVGLVSPAISNPRSSINFRKCKKCIAPSLLNMTTASEAEDLFNDVLRDPKRQRTSPFEINSPGMTTSTNTEPPRASLPPVGMLTQTLEAICYLRKVLYAARYTLEQHYVMHATLQISIKSLELYGHENHILAHVQDLMSQKIMQIQANGTISECRRWYIAAQLKYIVELLQESRILLNDHTHTKVLATNKNSYRQKRLNNTLFWTPEWLAARRCSLISPRPSYYEKSTETLAIPVYHGTLNPHKEILSS